jgi:hypothetical protein
VDSGGTMKTKFYDWLWYTFGLWLWKRASQRHPSEEVKRRLNWMTLDCRENWDEWRMSPEGRAWLIDRAHRKERHVN